LTIVLVTHGDVYGTVYIIACLIYNLINNLQPNNEDSYPKVILDNLTIFKLDRVLVHIESRLSDYINMTETTLSVILEGILTPKILVPSIMTVMN
jgi:hypothetical protein